MGKEVTRDVQIMLGDYRKAITAMSVPLFISLIIAQANTFIDTFWCSMLGSTALAAIGVVSSYYCIFIGIGSGIGIGVSAVIAAHIAAGRKEQADQTASQSIVFMTIIGLLCFPVMMLIGDPILSVVMSDAYEESIAYAHPFYICSVILVLQGILVGILRGEGAAKRSMVVTSLTAILNMVIDPVLAFGLDMGIAGLAWATVVSTLVSFIPFVYWYSVKKDTTYVDLHWSCAKPEKDVLSGVLAIGVPKAIELDIMWGLNFICCYFVGLCGGSTAMAVYTTGWKYVDIIQTPANALGAALITVGSAAYGVRDITRMRAAYRYTMAYSVVITLILAVLLFAVADYAVMIFSNSSSSALLEEPMAEAIRIYVIVAVLFAAIIISSSLLQAMRKAGCSMWSTLIRNITLIGTFALLCGTTPTTMWWGFVAVEIFGFVLMYFWAESEYRKLERSQKS